jgi:hypothetical protein
MPEIVARRIAPDVGSLAGAEPVAALQGPGADYERDGEHSEIERLEVRKSQPLVPK